MENKTIYIIILHYGEISVTQACIASILTFEKEIQKKIIIVNNTKTKLTNKNFIDDKEINIRNVRENLGFAKGVNMGITFALEKKAKYILLLNNDTILQKPIIKKLLSVFEKEKHAGIVGPAIAFLKKKKTVYDLGGKVNYFFGRTTHDEIEKK